MSHNKKDNCEYDCLKKCPNCKPNSAINKSLSRNDPYALYSKGLPHDSNGFVDKTAYCKYINAIINQSVDELNNVPKGGSLKQVDASAGWNDDLPDIIKLNNLGTVPKIDSPEYAANLIELYDMAYCRDVSFSDYTTDAKITTAINSLSQLSAYHGPAITVTTIFRGLSQGDVVGPYISQFLYLSYNTGGTITFDQKRAFKGPTDFMLTMPNAVSAQNGTTLESFGPNIPPRYIINGRDLAISTRLDEPYGIFYNAALVLYTLAIPQNPELPVNNNIGPFINFGKVDVLSCLGQVTRLAALACWCYKNRALLLRPEEGGIIVERKRLNIPNNPSIDDEIINNPIIATIFALNNTNLLPQAYPEGSPLHPSWPSGHATLAAAQAIILKFFFKTSDTMNLFAPDATGSNLVPSGYTSTVRNEIDKLTSNCGYGRSWASIHYRLDVEKGIKLGEKVGIAFLKKHVTGYPQKVKVHIKRYNGKTVVIEN
jgi:membrane-associated phospholipid phosphatase